MKRKEPDMGGKVDSMKFGTWFVAEISMSRSNPIFRAVCQQCGSGTIEIFAGDERIVTVPERLSFFRVICLIDEMNKGSYPNRFKLPPDCDERLVSLRVAIKA